MVSNGSLITKKVIAYAFKDLLKHTDFQKISIKDIMSHADYRRQTFYDHFSDKYELLDWIYHQEMTETIDHFINYDYWKKIVSRILFYFEKNKLFYQKTLIINSDSSFDGILATHLQSFFKEILLESDTKKLTPNQIKRNSSFYAHGLTGLIKEWLLDDCSTPISEMENIIINIIDTTTN
ncbi:MAG: dihydroxyacetone kinase transcriptional activator DhaS [Vagococcus sp.]|uniref:dihydroxyacetone kinase transcriptional activator DhaS n=1 Tax=Vagococcus sp. TaxID=1933889 RepID=UPI002FC927B9